MDVGSKMQHYVFLKVVGAYWKLWFAIVDMQGQIDIICFCKYILWVSNYLQGMKCHHLDESMLVPECESVLVKKNLGAAKNYNLLL